MLTAWPPMRPLYPPNMFQHVSVLAVELHSTASSTVVQHAELRDAMVLPHPTTLLIRLPLLRLHIAAPFKLRRHTLQEAEKDKLLIQRPHRMLLARFQHQ